MGEDPLYRIESMEQVADNIFECWVDAPQTARNAKAGQFLIIRVDEQGERIPLTISGVKGDHVRIVFMAVGTTTHKLASMKTGECLLDVVGPLGKPSEIRNFGHCVVVGGGVGIACLPIIAETLRAAGNRVTGVIGARNKDLLILEDELAGVCDELVICTDDGSKGNHCFPADILKKICEEDGIDAAWIIGPAIMMKITSGVTKPFGVKTFVSLNPIMVDGTGMCGSCRVIVDGETRFACVDGPEFDAHKVDWENLMNRQRAYVEEEKESFEIYRDHVCSCGGED